MKFNRRPLVAAEVSLTPLIDVVFLLLIFFVLTTRLPEHQLEINLPQLANPSSTNTISPPEKLLVINIFADQRLSLDNLPLENLTQLKQQLTFAQQQAATRQQTLSVKLRAEATAQHQQLVEVLELLQELELNQVQLGVLPAH